MAQSPVIREEVKTGKGIGPVTTSIGLAEAAVLVLVWVTDQFGVEVPVNVALAVVVLVAFGVGYFTKGRAYVEKVLPPDVPVPGSTSAYVPKHSTESPVGTR